MRRRYVVVPALLVAAALIVGALRTAARAGRVNDLDVVVHDPAPVVITRNPHDASEFTAQSSIVIDRPSNDVFGMILDWDNYPEYFEDIVMSRRLSSTVGGRTTLEQTGVETILGIHFKVTMKMEMFVHRTSAGRTIDFALTESKMMARCDGYSRVKSLPHGRSLFEYTVTVRPRGILKQFVGKPLQGALANSIPKRLRATAVAVETYLVNRRGR
jgi:hypothetical protein